MSMASEEKMLHLPEVEVEEQRSLPHSYPTATGQPTRKKVGSFTHRIRELSKSLVFAEDALSALASVPAPNSYASAHETSKQLFSHQTMSVPFRCRRRASKVGRHDTRGSGSKHLPCHLTQSLPYATEGGTQENARKAESAYTAKESSTTCNTTKDLTAYPRKERLSSLSKDKQHSARAEEGSTVFSVAEGISSIGSVAGPKAFVEHLAAGAKPLHLLQGSASTILLDDNALFKKVLQPRFPPPPNELHLADRDAEKTTTLEPTPDRRPLAFLQGHRRWLDLPQPIKVSIHAVIPYLMQTLCMLCVTLLPDCDTVTSPLQIL